ncbi:alpha/beta hydrolase-fold protein [Intrasporangium sp.]|uniref:alpha/beta hydrolase n=1 Tax=Intrasporangium sp. TaxID=1925024 RepID=UPI003221F343
MELTEPGPVILFAGVAVVLFLLLVLGRPRWGGRVARAGLRGAQVLVLNLAVVALCFTLLNDQYVFYSSWADLLGSRSTQVLEHHGGSARSAEQARVPGPSLADVSGRRDFRLPQPGARLQSYSLRYPGTGMTATVLVHLPSGYDPSSARTYPVVLGLHGFPGTPAGFAHLNFLATADTMTAEHRLAPSIFVIPTVDVPDGLDTECIDGPAGTPQTETWLAREIPEWAVQHLRVRTDRSAWVTMGYSYGGWCAALLAMRHPGIFGGAIVLQGYFRPDFLSGYDPLSPSALRPYDLVRLARYRPPPVGLWVLTSRQDSLSYPSTAAFLAAARAPLDVTATVLATGGHRASVFEPYSAAALTWVARTFEPFRG